MHRQDVGKYDQTIRIADRHVLLADEPIGIGDDTGPAPYDLLLAGLGACTNMTLRMYADRKGCDLVLEGPLDDEQRARLLEIADRCPVHKTMTSETRIVTELVVPS